MTNVQVIRDIFGQHYPLSRFGAWFTHPNAYLNGASPSAVLAMKGPQAVIDALHAEVAGSYA